MPDPYASPSQAREFYGLASDAGGPTFNVPYNNAARLVQRYAPAPDVVSADYEERAADAELEVGRFLFNSLGGSVSSLTATEGGLSFTNLGAVMGIIAGTMGEEFYTGGSADVAKVGWLG